MDFALQLVDITWTKRSRGGRAAARRNAAPIAFPPPDEPPPSVRHDLPPGVGVGVEEEPEGCAWTSGTVRPYTFARANSYGGRKPF